MHTALLTFLFSDIARAKEVGLETFDLGNDSEPASDKSLADFWATESPFNRWWLLMLLQSALVCQYRRYQVLLWTGR